MQALPFDAGFRQRPAFEGAEPAEISPHDDSNGFAWLNSQLEPKKLYELLPMGHNVLALKLTMAGWEKHEELKENNRRKSYCF